jgi:hypothetical protein
MAQSHRFFHTPKLYAVLIAITCTVVFPFQSKTAAASDRGAIAGAVIGGVAAAIIAAQIADASKRQQAVPPSSRPRHVTTSHKQKPAAKKESATAENKQDNDPFAGVTPTVSTRVRGQ